MQDLAAILPFLAIAVLFWFLAIRPQQRRARELQAMQQSLSVGDDVMLTSGVYGTLIDIDEETVRLEIAPGVTIKVARGAVGRRNDEPGERPTATPEEN